MKQFSLDEYLANPTKKLITRNGRKVKRILCTDARGDYPVVALIEFDDTSDVAYTYTKDGKFHLSEPGGKDLFFATEKHEGWINIFKSSNDIAFLGQSRIFESKEDAEKGGKYCNSYAATIKIEWEE